MKTGFYYDNGEEIMVNDFISGISNDGKEYKGYAKLERGTALVLHKNFKEVCLLKDMFTIRKVNM